MKKILYVVLDGLGDDVLEELGERTPLEAAATPNLDRLASMGRLGQVRVVGPGIAPESDVAVFAILGYDPTTSHTGRGPLEALGAGLPFEPGDLAWRANFATVDKEGRILDRRAGRDLATEEASSLAELIQREVRLPGASFSFRATVEHRASLVIRDEAGPLSDQVSNTDPAYRREGALGVALERFEEKIQECRALVEDERAHRAAELTNIFVDEARRILAGAEANRARERRGRPPANAILTRDAGNRLPGIRKLKEVTGADWGCFVEMPVERGIALVTGMDPIEVPRPEGMEERYRAWAWLASEAMEGYDALYIHIKGPDLPAHDGDGPRKREVIALIDRAFFGELLPALRLDRTVVAVTADHATSSARKAHTDYPVPLLLAGAGVSPDGTGVFGEREAARGSLGLLRGTDVVPLLVDAARG